MLSDTNSPATPTLAILPAVAHDPSNAVGIVYKVMMDVSGSMLPAAGHVKKGMKKALQGTRGGVTPGTELYTFSNELQQSTVGDFLNKKTKCVGRTALYDTMREVARGCSGPTRLLIVTDGADNARLPTSEHREKIDNMSSMLMWLREHCPHVEIYIAFVVIGEDVAEHYAESIPAVCTGTAYVDSITYGSVASAAAMVIHASQLGLGLGKSDLKVCRFEDGQLVLPRPGSRISGLGDGVDSMLDWFGEREDSATIEDPVEMKRYMAELVQMMPTALGGDDVCGINGQMVKKVRKDNDGKRLANCALKKMEGAMPGLFRVVRGATGGCLYSVHAAHATAVRRWADRVLGVVPIPYEAAPQLMLCDASHAPS